MFSEIKYLTKNRKAKTENISTRKKQTTKKTHSVPLTILMAVVQTRRKTKSEPLLKTKRNKVFEKAILDNNVHYHPLVKGQDKTQLLSATGNITDVIVSRETPKRSQYKKAKTNMNENKILNKEIDLSNATECYKNSPQSQLTKTKHNNRNITKKTNSKYLGFVYLRSI